MSNIDIISLRDINLRFEDRRRLLRGVGLEITVSDLRRPMVSNSVSGLPIFRRSTVL